MSSIDSAFSNLGYLDALAYLDTPIHRLDPRVKLLTTLTFIVVVLTFDKYQVGALIPFFVYPVVLLALGNLPVGYFLRKLLLAAPFVLFVGIFNPLLDREVLVRLGPFGVSGGWLSLASILIRFVLTVSAALILVATTGFHPVCMALEKLGLPKGFVVQLLFLYRYLFVLVEEAVRLSSARALRSFGKRGMGIRVFSFIIGQWLLRTLDRAQRIHQAMLCRGFNGEIRSLRPLRVRLPDLVFLAGWSAIFILMRFHNLPQSLGRLVTGLP